MTKRVSTVAWGGARPLHRGGCRPRFGGPGLGGAEQLESSGTGDNTRTRDIGCLIDDGDPVHFNICPGSAFDFLDLNDTLVVETPLRNPLAVDCLPDINKGSQPQCPWIFEGEAV